MSIFLHLNKGLDNYGVSVENYFVLLNIVCRVENVSASEFFSWIGIFLHSIP
jgi:hypothetical protein